MNIEISEMAWNYLQSRAVPFEDTPSTVLDRIIAEHQTGERICVEGSKPVSTNAQKKSGPTFSTSNIPIVTFTDILNAKVNGVPSQNRYWNNVLVDVVDACVEAGGEIDAILARMFLNYDQGHLDANGYYYAAKADITLKGSSAKRVLKQIMDLSQQFDIAVEIEWRWQQKEQAQMPGEIGKLILP